MLKYFKISPNVHSNYEVQNHLLKSFSKIRSAHELLKIKCTLQVIFLRFSPYLPGKIVKMPFPLPVVTLRTTKEVTRRRFSLNYPIYQFCFHYLIAGHGCSW